MLDVFYSVPIPVSTVAIVAVVALLSASGLLWVRRTVPLTVLRGNHEVAGHMIALIGGVYAVLLAFVVFAVWSAFGSADRTVVQEAASLGDLYRLSLGYPEPTRGVLRERIETYGRIVVDEEWPAMARGEESQTAWDALDALWGEHLALAPRTPTEGALYAESLSHLAALGDAHRLRLLDSREGLPGIFWAVLVIGGVLTVGSSFFFGMENVRAHVVLTAALAGEFALLLVLILALDHPYRGELRVGPEAFEQVLRIIRR